MSKKFQPTSRVLRELLETATGLSEYGLVSGADMTRMNELCQVPSKRGVPPVDDVCLQDERETKSSRCSGKFRD